MSNRRFAVWPVLLSCTAFALMTPVSGFERSRPEPRLSTASRSVVVTTVAELAAALSAGTGETIFVQAGTYQLDHAIQVPDNTALIGQGTMLYDDSGLPTGFAPEGRTVINSGSRHPGCRPARSHGRFGRGGLVTKPQ